MVDAFMPPSWKEAADSIAYDSSTWPPPISLICGPGNSGKSTFSRLLVDTLWIRYRRVGYLDTDLGQPEFTPPGCLSLHIIDNKTPDLSILCFKRPYKCFFFGDVSLNTDPERYLNNIFSLYDNFIKENHQFSKLNDHGKPMLPLVINTPGWAKGVGYDLLSKLVRYVSPSHVVQIRVPEEDKNLPPGMFWLEGNKSEVVNLIEICAACTSSLRRSVSIRKEARAMRDLRIIAYFRQCLPRDLDISTYKELAHSLTSIPPYEVPLSRIVVIHRHSQVSSTEVIHGLKATIVGMTVSSSVPSSTKCSEPWCVGLGFIKSVDISRGLMYVITPVLPIDLKNVNHFVQGSITVPPMLLQVCEMPIPSNGR